METIIFTVSVDSIALMPCNPNIGGTSKGHLVREIDALDGLMGKVIDKAGIQFRMLNASKGPAVRGPRAQADRKLYKKYMLEELQKQDNLDIIEGSVEGILFVDDKINGVIIADETKILSNSSNSSPSINSMLFCPFFCLFG